MNFCMKNIRTIWNSKFYITILILLTIETGFKYSEGLKCHYCNGTSYCEQVNANETITCSETEGSCFISGTGNSLRRGCISTNLTSCISHITGSECYNPELDVNKTIEGKLVKCLWNKKKEVSKNDIPEAEPICTCSGELCNEGPLPDKAFTSHKISKDLSCHVSNSSSNNAEGTEPSGDSTLSTEECGIKDGACFISGPNDNLKRGCFPAITAECIKFVTESDCYNSEVDKNKTLEGKLVNCIWRGKKEVLPEDIPKGHGPLCVCTDALCNGPPIPEGNHLKINGSYPFTRNVTVGQGGVGGVGGVGFGFNGTATSKCYYCTGFKGSDCESGDITKINASLTVCPSGICQVLKLGSILSVERGCVPSTKVEIANCAMKASELGCVTQLDDTSSINYRQCIQELGGPQNPVDANNGFQGSFSFPVPGDVNQKIQESFRSACFCKGDVCNAAGYIGSNGVIIFVALTVAVLSK